MEPEPLRLADDSSPDEGRVRAAARAPGLKSEPRVEKFVSHLLGLDRWVQIPTWAVEQHGDESSSIF